MSTVTATQRKLAAVLRTSDAALQTLEEFRAGMQASWAKGFLSDYSGIGDYAAVEARAKVWGLAARYAKGTSPSAGEDLMEQALVAAMDCGHGSSEFANAYSNIERRAWREVYNLLADRKF